MGWARDTLTPGAGTGQVTRPPRSVSGFPTWTLSLVPRFSASDSSVLLSECLSLLGLPLTIYLSFECVSALLPCVSLQISSDLISTPILLLGPPQISGLRGPQSQLKGERAASVSRGHTRRPVLETFGECAPESSAAALGCQALPLSLPGEGPECARGSVKG